VQRVLVFFGGADTGKATGKVLRALDGMRRDGLGAFMVDAVVSALHPEREALVDFCARRPGWACHVQTDRMADLMAAADLAVGAGGGTLWERCAVGLPAVVVPKNPAQGVQVAAAAEAGLVCAPRVHGDGPEGWRAHIEALWLDDVRRRQMSAKALASVDGRGAERGARAMRPAPLGRRPQAQRQAA
jgi:UDP-2,4-diacetamido-2,4,6-trideoxy-beta-L-altropyranose hydrolase